MTAPITDNPHESKKAAAKVHKLPTDNATKMSGGAKTVIYAVLAFFTVVFLFSISFIICVRSFLCPFSGNTGQRKGVLLPVPNQQNYGN